MRSIVHFSSASGLVEVGMAQRVGDKYELPPAMVWMKWSHMLMSVLMVPILAVVVI